MNVLYQAALDKSSITQREDARTTGGGKSNKPVSKTASPSEDLHQPVHNSQDKNDITAREETAQGRKLVQDAINELKNTYGNINIVILSLDNGDEIKQFAASHSKGAYLLLSPEFLKKMASDEGALQKGKDILNGILQKLSGSSQNAAGKGAYVTDKTAAFWETAETPPWQPLLDDAREGMIRMMKDMMKASEEKKYDSKYSFSQSSLNGPVEIAAKTARANNISGVKMAIAEGEQKKYVLKLAMSFSSGQEKNKIRAALAQLERTIVYAEGKIKDLKEEEDLQQRIKKAQKLLQERRAEQIRAELKKKQTSRYGRDHAQVMESEQWRVYVDMMESEKELHRAEAVMEMPLVCDTFTPAAGAAGGAISTAEVTITAVAEIAF